GLPGGAGAAEAHRSRFLPLIEAVGASGSRASHAASFLAAIGADPARQGPRIRELAGPPQGKLPDPGGAAAVLASIGLLQAGEIANWVEKAGDIVRARRLAPSAPELAVLGAAIVHGLPRAEFSINGNGPESTPWSATAGLLTIHRWLYRPLVSP